MQLYYQTEKENKITFEQLKTAKFTSIILFEESTTIDTCGLKCVTKQEKIKNNSFVFSENKKIYPDQKNIGIVNEADLFLNRGYIDALYGIIVVEPDKLILFKSMFPSKEVVLLNNDLISALEEIICPEFLNVIIQFYNTPDNDRMHEIIKAVLINLNNPYVAKVYNLCENESDTVPKEISTHRKYKKEILNKWYTFKDVFDFCNKNLNDKYCCLINLDIALDNEVKWDNIKSDLDKSIVYALSRHEYIDKKMDSTFEKLFHCHTQDAWLFKAPVMVKNCNLEVGLLGSDNVIAHRFKESGYKLFNKAREYKIYHIDNVRGKNSSNFKDHHIHQKRFHPDKEGCFLLPCYEDIINIKVDDLMKELSVDNNLKYEIICKIFTERIKINNS